MRIPAAAVMLACTLATVSMPALSPEPQPSNLVRSSGAAVDALQKARLKLGGNAKLDAVRSFMVESSRTPVTGTRYLSTYWSILPDRFQDVGLMTWTLSGASFWSQPPTRTEAAAGVAGTKRRLFAELTLLLLLRGTTFGQIEGSLTTVDWNGASHRGLRFSGRDSFQMTVVISPTDELLGYEMPTTFMAPSGETAPAVRRVTILDRQVVDGISVPREMRDEVAGHQVTIVFSRVVWNSGVDPARFVKQ